MSKAVRNQQIVEMHANGARQVDIAEKMDITRQRVQQILAREADHYPPRRRLGDNVVAWRSDEIEEWMENRPPANGG